MLSRWRLQKADVGWHDESGRGMEEDAVTKAAGMSSCGGGGVDDATRGGGGRLEASLSLWRTATMGGIFPRPWRDGKGCGDAAVPSDRRWRR